MSKQSILIELTPLLDVIMIMMFLILVQSQGRIDTVYTETQETFAANLEAAEAEFLRELETALTGFDTAIADFREYHLDNFAQMDDLRQQIAAFDGLMLGLEEDTGTIMVRHHINPANSAIHYVTVESPSREATITLYTDPAGRSNATFALNAALSEQISRMDNSVIFVIFAFNGREVYRDDWMLVQTAINTQRIDNPYVFTLMWDSQ